MPPAGAQELWELDEEELLLEELDEELLELLLLVQVQNAVHIVGSSGLHESSAVHVCPPRQ